MVEAGRVRGDRHVLGAVTQRAGFRFRQRNQIGQRFYRQIRRDYHNTGHRCGLRHRRKIVERVVSRILVNQRVDEMCLSNHHQRVTVGDRFGDKVHVNVTSYNYNVLLTGEAPDAQTKAELIAAIDRSTYSAARSWRKPRQ